MLNWAGGPFSVMALIAALCLADASVKLYVLPRFSWGKFVNRLNCRGRKSRINRDKFLLSLPLASLSSLSPFLSLFIVTP